MTVAKRRAGGFSLIELVIVVVIIGIIGAIAIPRMSRGAEGAGDSALKGNLAVMRSAIDLFATEHGGAYPSLANLPTAMTQYSNELGTVFSATKTATEIYGPYMRAIPPLPVGQNKTETGFALISGGFTAVGNVGWLYDPTSGRVISNTDVGELDAKGVAYSAY